MPMTEDSIKPTPPKRKRTTKAKAKDEAPVVEPGVVTPSQVSEPAAQEAKVSAPAESKGPAREIVACVESFATMVNGAPMNVRIDDLFYADDPIVKSNPHKFGPPKVKVSRRGHARVEQASAWPGEVRG